MGQSTDGILFYGVALGEGDGEAQEEALEDGEESFAAFLAGKEVDWDGQEAVLKRHGIEVVRYCSGDYPMYGLAVRGTVNQVSRGDALELGQKIVAPKAINPRYGEVLAKLGITATPQWILVSDWC